MQIHQVFSTDMLAVPLDILNIGLERLANISPLLLALTILITPPILYWIIRRFGSYIAKAGFAASFIATVNFIFNYPFTIWIVTLENTVIATLTWIVIGVAINYACVLWYKHTTTDWFGFEFLRMKEAVEAKGLVGKIVRFSLKKSRLVAFILISTLLDPIYGFIYQRGRVSGKKFDLGDWWWFFASNLLGMLPWLLSANIIVSVIEIIFGTK